MFYRLNPFIVLLLIEVDALRLVSAWFPVGPFTLNLIISNYLNISAPKSTPNLRVGLFFGENHVF